MLRTPPPLPRQSLRILPARVHPRTQWRSRWRHPLRCAGTDWPGTIANALTRERCADGHALLLDLVHLSERLAEFLQLVAVERPVAVALSLLHFLVVAVRFPDQI